MGRATAAEVVSLGGSAVIIAEDQDKVDDTVKTLAHDGQAWGITADLADRGRGPLLAEGDHDLPAVGIADHRPLEHVTHTARDPLEQIDLVRRVGAHPEPSASDEHLGDHRDLDRTTAAIRA